MSRKHAEQMLKTLEDQSAEYAQKASRLSDLLELAECFLQEMPGKVAAEFGDRTHLSGKIMFIRCQDEWRLVFESQELQEDEFVCESTVQVKARAAILLPELMRLIFDTRSSRLQMVEQALEGLEKLPFLAVGIDKEGK
jgi:hypothetical protein